ncbi:MAG: carbohydrate kinase family protein [Phycisphaerae bacterium]|nr:carbohydrate kinase family protein [Phycisphaerae bacterium]
MSHDIVNIGICTVDTIARTINEAPPPGGLRTFDDLTVTTGGNAMNCGIALAKMGVGCDVVIKVGRDALGDFVLSEAKRHGLGTKGIIIDDKGTTTPFTFVCVHSDGQRSFYHICGTNGTLRNDEIDMDYVKQHRYCFVTGTMVMPTFDGAQTAEVLRQAKDAGLVTLLDTVYTDAASQDQWRSIIVPCLPHLTYFIPSQPEAAAITGLDKAPDMARWLQDNGCANAVIKMDAAGAYCRVADGTETEVPAYQVDNVVDTTGAGDCWSAGFLAGLAAGESVPEAAALGNATAAQGIQAPGASTGIVPLEQIREFQRSAPRRNC